MIRERILTLGTIPLFLAALAMGQQTAPTDSGVVIRTETKVVLVDAIVTDKKGNYVHDLTAKDFKVWEDNKEQTIKSFSFESGAANPTAPPQTRYIVLFFDNSTMPINLQAQARQAAGKFIDANAGPKRMMAIVNFTGSIQIAQNFTDDAERLKAIVSGAKISSVNPNSNDSSMPDSLNRAASDFGATDLLLSLRTLAKNLNSVPGRKTVILFSGGFPLTPDRMSEATATIDACNQSNVAIYPVDARGVLAPTASLFPTAGRLLASSVLFPGSLSFFQKGGGGGGAGGGGGKGGGGGAPGGGGSPGGGRGGAPSPAPTSGRGGTNNPMNPMMNPNNPNNRAQQARNALIPKMPEGTAPNQNVMFMLADGTGGFVIHDTNDLFGGLDRIGKELNEYYLLGYTPPESDAGSCHTLKVKVDQGGVSVRARTGYCNSKPHDLLTKNEPIEKTLENRMAGTQPGNIMASMQAPFFYTGPDVARVNVAMDIPGSAMKFEKQKGKYVAEMNILGIAYRPDGSVGARFSDTVKREFEDKKQMEAFEKEPFHYENQFDAAAGQYNLKVAFTTANDKFGKLELPLLIDPWESKTFAISGLALSDKIRQTTDANSLDESLLEDRTPLITQGVQVIPAGSTTFTKAQPPLFYVELYEPPDKQADKPAFGLDLTILDRKTGEQKFSTGMMRVDLPAKSSTPVIALGEKIPVDKVGPGQYVLQVQALDEHGATVKRSADFNLE